MSMRTLIELNHDYSDRLTGTEFQTLLGRWLASGAKSDAEALERFGARVVGLRHHSDKFIVDAGADGFPCLYLTPRDSGSGPSGRRPVGAPGEAPQSGGESRIAQIPSEES